ncbi:MAG: cell division protein FtsZ, partial [Candidatus Diapherotrites archaeon]|nr:cell division protein FtsZ [Candidatus Diapherotrites archaeon]
MPYLESVVKKALKLAKTRPAKGKRKIKATHDNEDLIKLLETAKAKIRVVGVGGGGCNTIERMTEVGITGAETFAVNTDAQDLLSTVADKKMLIGRQLTRGLGSGSDPSVGEGAARESIEELEDVLHDSDLIFITCGM